MALDTSVVITCHNKGRYVGRAIRSCIKQSMRWERFEIVVVDDASTDNSIRVLKSFKKRIRLFPLKENVGVAEASNIGIRNALGTFIVRLDADDYFGEHALLFMTELLLHNPEIGFIYCDHLAVDEREKILGRINLDTPQKLLRHGAGIMFRKTNLEILGLYNSNLKNAEDYELLKRYLKNFDGYHLKLPLYRYRQLPDSLSRQNREKWEQKADELLKNS